MYARQQCEREGKRIEVIHRKDMLVRAVCCLSCRLKKEMVLSTTFALALIIVLPMGDKNATSAKKELYNPFSPAGMCCFPAEELLKLSLIKK